MIVIVITTTSPALPPRCASIFLVPDVCLGWRIIFLVALRIAPSLALQDAVANQLAERFLHGESFVRFSSFLTSPDY